LVAVVAALAAAAKVVVAAVPLQLLQQAVLPRLLGPKNPLVCANLIRFNTRWAQSPTGVLFLSS